MPLSKKDILDLKKLVSDHLKAISVSVLGPGVIGSREVNRLVSNGVLDESVLSSGFDPIEEFYIFGTVRKKIEEAGIDSTSISYDQLRSSVISSLPKVGSSDAKTISSIKAWAGEHLSESLNRITGSVMQMVQSTDSEVQMKIRSLVSSEVAVSMVSKESVDVLARKLLDLTKDYSRDWVRVASFEMQRAQEEGAARSILEEFGDESIVSKIPNPDACQECRSQYLDQDGLPKKFRITDLISNGTNRGRKRSDWVPTLEPLHPFCHCRIMRVPPGYEFDNNWSLVKTDDKEDKIGYEKLTPEDQIIINTTT